jgi:hypothetical protein
VQGSRTRKKRLDTCQALFLCRRVEPDHHDGFATLLHAADQVLRAGRAPIPARQEQVAGLRHLVVAAHASAFSTPLPISAKELMRDRVLPGPAVAELLGATGAAGQDWRDAVGLWCQPVAQALIVGARRAPAMIRFMITSLGWGISQRKKAVLFRGIVLRALCCSDTQG